MKIQEDYVSFETAKLLKEKGFDCSCEHQYINCSSGHPFLTDIRDDAGCYYKNSEIGEDEYSAPTLQMAMKWLREEHDIFIKLEFDVDEDIQWHPSLALIKGNKYIHTNELQWYDTYEQAVEVAIKYCLNNHDYDKRTRD